MLLDIQARLLMPGRLLCHGVTSFTQEKHYRLIFSLAKLLFWPSSLTLDWVPHSCSPAEMTISDSAMGLFGPQVLCCVELAPSRRCSGLNGILLSPKNFRCAIILKFTSSHFISRLFSAKETPRTANKSASTKPKSVHLTRVAIFFFCVKKQAGVSLISVKNYSQVCGDLPRSRTLDSAYAGFKDRLETL